MIICQVRKNLPAQACGEPADQIYKCEQIAPPGHICAVGEHTILHERMGNGYSCTAVEEQITKRDGLIGWITGGRTSYTRIGV